MCDPDFEGGKENGVEKLEENTHGKQYAAYGRNHIILLVAIVKLGFIVFEYAQSYKKKRTCKPIHS